MVWANATEGDGLALCSTCLAEVVQGKDAIVRVVFFDGDVGFVCELLEGKFAGKRVICCG
jgi:hypothetical protein